MTTLDFLIALRDGIDTPELHCDPLPVTSSWRYMVDNAIERENSMADKFAAAIKALRLAINTVDCASLDSFGNDLPWYRAARNIVDVDSE